MFSLSRKTTRGALMGLLPGLIIGLLLGWIIYQKQAEHRERQSARREAAKWVKGSGQHGNSSKAMGRPQR